MPGGDRTGPWGLGPRTGRAAGYCAGYPAPGYANPGFGRGFGRGWGRGFARGYRGRGGGFRWRNYYYDPIPYYPDQYPTVSVDEEKKYLETLVKDIEEELNAIRGRIDELSKQKKEEQ